MKKLIVTLLAIAGLVSVFLWYQQSRKTAEEQAKLAAVEKRLTEAEDLAVQHEMLSRSQQAQLQETRAELVEKEGKVAQLQRTAAASNHTPSRTPNKAPMSELLKDPQMKSVLKK
jgi:biopolymer transport protein ExbB/TolQ